MRLISLLFCTVFLSLTACRQSGNETQSSGHSQDAPEGMAYVPPFGKTQGFYIDQTEVTNKAFASFVEATGYVTDAEQPFDWEKEKEYLPEGTPKPPDSLLKAGSLVFQPSEGPLDLRFPDQWWAWTLGASWRHPAGPESRIEGLMDHPVVHVSWQDAVAYAEWAGKRLPTEREWEVAAYGGNAKHKFAWGNDSPEVASGLANFWQGDFPYNNSKQDGYFHSSPAKTYPANSYGLYDMAGNVWEWCQDEIHDPQEPLMEKHVVKGGSFLCNEVYCSGYQIDGNMSSSKDSGLNHTGFRCVKDLE